MRRHDADDHSDSLADLNRPARQADRGRRGRRNAPCTGRRCRRAALLAFLALLVTNSGLRGAEDGTSVGEPAAVTPFRETAVRIERAAIEKALRYLASKSLPDGSIGRQYKVAVTSLAGLAFLGAGYRPSHGGKYATEIEKCLQYILSCAGNTNTGFITEGAEKGESRMHGHCFAILFLTQIHGELPADQQPRVAAVIRNGIRCIERAQSRRGGWYYYADNSDHLDEASVTIGALQALRAAKNVGFGVDSTVIRNAKRYVHDCQVKDGGFKYSIKLSDGGRVTFALTAAAVSTLHAAGDYNSEVLERGFDYMLKELADAKHRPQRAIRDPFFFYGAMYATQAFFQRGGESWARWRAEIRKYLLSKQQSAGSWEDSYGDEYGTAMAALILEVPIQYLPIFQR